MTPRLTQTQLPASGSYWLPERADAYPPVRGESKVDVAVIGGGIVGVTAAHLLKQAGKSVALVEARRIGGQVTGHSTAKVTSLHKLIYADLVRRFDEETARLYGQANEAALAQIAQLVESSAISCDFSRQPAYTVCFDRDNIDALREEAEVAAGLGLPASYVDEPPLPIPAKGAVRFSNQAQFHPYRYLSGLARKVAVNDGHVFEETRVQDVEEGDLNVLICPEGKVIADDVVVATNLPFLDRGGFFTKAYPRHHVAAAARLPSPPGFDGMFINVEDPTRSVRWHRDGEIFVLIATGAAYRPGEADPAALVAELEAWLKAHFPIEGLETAWTNEDFDSMDGMPFVGKLRSSSPRIWVATGFGAWGITSGTAAAMILRDLILGRHNAYSGIFDSTRLNPIVSAPEFIRSNLNVGKEIIRDHLSAGERRSVDELAPGEGAVIEGKIAAYRDEAGKLHLHDAKCTHMGCIVAWNPISKSWDCPCHGSSFDSGGEVRFGPAISPLRPSDS